MPTKSGIGIFYLPHTIEQSMHGAYNLARDQRHQAPHRKTKGHKRSSSAFGGREILFFRKVKNFANQMSLLLRRRREKGHGAGRRHHRELRGDARELGRRRRVHVVRRHCDCAARSDGAACAETQTVKLGPRQLCCVEPYSHQPARALASGNMQTRSHLEVAPHRWETLQPKC